MDTKTIVQLLKSRVELPEEGEDPGVDADIVQVLDIVLGGHPAIRDWLWDRISNRELINAMRNL
jgi:hypothetical protein